MKSEYVIDDKDSYNWTLEKPLSSYTQEELAEELINKKNESGGKTQKVRLSGAIGALLNTDACFKPEDFIEKYHEILDYAGFPKGKLSAKTVVKEEAKVETKKEDKATKKEELKAKSDNKVENIKAEEKTEKVEKKETAKKEEKPKTTESIKTTTKVTTKPKAKVASTKKASTNESKSKKKKNDIKIITIPTAMIKFSQEDIARLAMDNKTTNQEVGIKINGVILDTIGCKTVDDFVDKNEKVAESLGFNHDYTEKINKAGPIIDSRLSRGKEESKVEDIKDEVVINDFSDVNNTPIIPLLKSMLENKKESNKDITVNYNGTIITTEGSDELENIVEKYKEVILNQTEKEREELLKNKELRKAVILFNLPSRGNYYNDRSEDDFIYDEYYAGEDNIENKQNPIIEKNKEYAKLMSEKDSLDFNDTEAVYEWLNKLVPYINTHALTLNQGLNVSVESADKYLLKVMEEKGYNSDITDANNMQDNYKYAITTQLNELATYHFFISDYKDLPERDKNLNSVKTTAMVEVEYLEGLLKKGEYGIELVDKNLDERKAATEIKITEIERQMDLLNFELMEKGDKFFDDKATTELEKEAVKSYKLASVTYGLEDVENTIDLVNKLPEDSKIKKQLSDAAYNLFVKRSEDKETRKEVAEYYEKQGVDYKPIFTSLEDENGKLALRNECIEKIEKVKNSLREDEARLEEKRNRLLKYNGSVAARISSLRSEFKLDDIPSKKVETTEEIKEDAYAEAVEEEAKESLFSKVRNLFNKQKEESEFDLSLQQEKQTEEIDGVINKNSKFTDSEKVVEYDPSEEANEEEKVEIEEAKNEITELSVINEENYDLKLPSSEIKDDDYNLNLDPSEDSLNTFTPIKSFKKISKELYDKINNSKIKEVIKKGVEKLKQNKKAALVYASFATVIIVGATLIASKTNATDLSNLKSQAATETTLDNDDNSLRDDSSVVIAQNIKESPDIKANPTFETLTLDKEEEKNETASNATEELSEEEANTATKETQEENYSISLDEASTDAISKILDGTTNVYGNSTDAYQEVNSISNDRLYKPSWETAKGGNYYVEEDGQINQISKEEAETIYQDGGNIVQMIENDGVPIGFINVDNENSGKTL